MDRGGLEEFLVYFFNPAKVPEGHFYYGKAKVNVSIPEDFWLSALVFFLRLWIGTSFLFVYRTYLFSWLPFYDGFFMNFYAPLFFYDSLLFSFFLCR